MLAKYRLSMVAACLALAVVAPGGSASDFGRPTTARTSSPTNSRSLLQEEAAVRAFEEAALARGALGFSLDEGTGGLVVALPPSAASQFRIADLPSPGIPVRAAVHAVERDDIDRVYARVVEAQRALDAPAA